MKALVLEEFDRFYLCKSKFGYKECFLKKDVTTLEENGKKYVKYKRLYESLCESRLSIKNTKINRRFNSFNCLKK